MQRTLLLVDDEPNVLKALKRLLYKEDYQILTADSGAEGLQQLADHKVNVIVSDQRMPNMTGVEFLGQVFELYPDTVRIVLSGYADFSAVTDAINKGAIYKFFTKPWNDDQMLANVFEAFRHSELNIKNEQLTRIFESTLEGILITDVTGVIQSVNPAFTFITGYSAIEAIGNTPMMLKSDRHDTSFFEKMWQSLVKHGQWEGEVWNQRKNGEVYPLWLVLTAIKGMESKPSQYVGLFNDITEQKKNEQCIRFQAYHDALTELPNRLLFNDRLQVALAQALRASEKLAIMFIDLDRFKNINDSLGHAVGDQLLQEMAKRLQKFTRDEDTVARMGGDEFTILLPRFTRVHDVEQLALKILNGISLPFHIEGQELVVTSSIGISLYPNDGETLESLMKNADSAMYRAKDQGRNKYQLYNADMNAGAIEHLTMETQLRHALERNEFCLYYQPQVDINSGRLIGFEALLRWLHPQQGLLAPGKFITLLEETGLIVSVGEWILNQSCCQNFIWREAAFTPVRVAVNVSSFQFRATHINLLVAAALERSGLDAGGLEVEITEGAIMDNVTQNSETLQQLRDMGVAIAIDDFGTGYSSLSYLKQFPVDMLKIDQSFVRDITCNPQDMEIVRSIITMAHGLGLGAIAEGVEIIEQLELLRSLGCDQVQGYYTGRPLEVEQATALLKQSARLPILTIDTHKSIKVNTGEG
ncbi:diguanylate cyclase/phosphodiesterase (GGDEF & EAL domains) with PAS/PAC sensor(s) [hydrothermal vent metagenome]|uniref:Diguanylate cyclase/phosphodiesterase (GGDEF & EAL domains) with PAS/PAC sensor(S) n=1 Tax=hydrothermal vent metagenome TaxID=652676 RepID=A0A3B1ADS0_9ZZZZ